MIICKYLHPRMLIRIFHNKIVLFNIALKDIGAGLSFRFVTSREFRATDTQNDVNFRTLYWREKNNWHRLKVNKPPFALQQLFYLVNWLIISITSWILLICIEWPNQFLKRKYKQITAFFVTPWGTKRTLQKNYITRKRRLFISFWYSRKLLTRMDLRRKHFLF